MPNALARNCVFAQIGIVNMLVQPCTVHLEKCMQGRRQVMDGGIDNFSVRGKSQSNTG